MARRILAVIAVASMVGAILLLVGCGQDSSRIDGAGATFPYPVYSKWANEFKQVSGVQINYQPIGSGGGVQQIKAKTVDFGASDAPLKAEELDKAGLMQFPMVIGGVVLVVNVEGVKPGELRLTPEILAGIYLGKLTKWSDPAIAAENQSLELPDKDITVVNRADGSGTTWIFTNYLDKVSEQWHNAVGFGKAVQWPTGVGAKGNNGVASQVQELDNSIGYVEYAFALENDMTYVALKNKAGNYVEPTIESFQAAAQSADWKNAPGYYVVLTNQPGDGSWPMTGASYIIIYKDQSDETVAANMLKFFDWCYNHGDDTARQLHYVPMPEDVVEQVQEKWRREITSHGKAVWQR